MSTNSECEFFEPEKGKWYYALEQKWGDEDYGGDWRDDAKVVGHFPTLEEAKEEMFSVESNPGGYTELNYEYLSTVYFLEDYKIMAKDALPPW